MNSRLISDPDELLPYLKLWENLADAAIEPNPFYEHWMFLPAMRNLRAGRDVRVLLVSSDGDSNVKDGQLCGVFPLERLNRYKGFPVSGWAFWRHAHCFLTTPLLRKECASEALATLFDWLSSEGKPFGFLEWRYLAGDGSFHQLLIDELYQRGILPLISEWFTRPLFRPLDNAEQYFTAVLSGKHRKALRRRNELLSELGRVEFTPSDPSGDIEAWLAQFLRIEASGWKGKEGSALASREGHRSFFLSAAKEALYRNRLLMPAILLEGKPIAQNCYFRAGRGVFHFKPAFDENYSRFSPGFHLECENIRYLHTVPEIEWLDSCTGPDNEMFNRLFRLRRTIQSLVIPGTGMGRLVVSGLPLLRLLKKSIAPIPKVSQRDMEVKDREGELVR